MSALQDAVNCGESTALLLGSSDVPENFITMTEEAAIPEEIVRRSIVSETAKIGWKELMREFAGGKTLLVDHQLDMVEVAYQLHRDNTAYFADWLEAEQVRQVSDDEARQWYDGDVTVWACVIRPWVLIQLSD